MNCMHSFIGGVSLAAVTHTRDRLDSPVPLSRSQAIGLAADGPITAVQMIPAVANTSTGRTRLLRCL